MTGRTLKTFLSYAKERLGEVRPVHQFIGAVGMESWLDKESLVGGDVWDVERRAAQDDADLFLAVVSREWNTRDGVIHRELRDALAKAKDKRPGRLFIVPLRLDDVPLPDELAGHHAIDLFAADWKARLARTLEKAAQQQQCEVPQALEVAAASEANGPATSLSHTEEDDTGSRSMTYIEYQDAGAYWDYVNAEIRRIALGGLYAYRRLMADWPRELGASYWECHVEPFHRRGELVSITVGESDYFPCRPYPNHRVTTLNLFGPTCGRVTIQDLFDHEPKAFSALKIYSDLMLRQPGQPFADEDIGLAHFAEGQGWELFEHYNVNERGLILNFSGANLPHVLGVFDVYMPWEVVAAYLPSSIRTFLQRNGMAIA